MDRCKIRCLHCQEVFIAPVQRDYRAAFVEYYDNRRIECPECRRTTYVSQANLIFDEPSRRVKRQHT